jgi:hypothetical protein
MSDLNGLDRRAWIWGVVVTFLAQWAWEVAHGPAYRETTGPVLWRITHCLPMAAIDSVWSIVLIVAVQRSLARSPQWVVLPSLAAAGAVSATFVEWRALNMGRWTYTSLMPRVPVVHVGLWPVLQMTIIPTCVWWLILRPRRTRG